jgi:ssDNA-binding Zn-finger/Zn-ribbon topoisomerase 1
VTAPAPIACPGCDGPMDVRRLDAHYGRSVELDLCHGCGLIWFDARESIALTPGAVLHLFAALDAHREQRQALRGEGMRCPRCRRTLAATLDRQRTTTFAYWRCPEEHGRLTTFFDFLREKDFVRPLSPERLAELRAYARTINCSACGAPVDLARGSTCLHCRAPLSMLDPDRVQQAVRELQAAEQRRTTVDPTYAARLVSDRATLERAFRSLPGETRPGLGEAFGLVESGITALVRLLRD